MQNVEKITKLLTELQEAIKEYNHNREQGAPKICSATSWVYRCEAMVDNCPNDWDKKVYDDGDVHYNTYVNGVEFWELRSKEEEAKNNGKSE